MTPSMAQMPRVAYPWQARVQWWARPGSGQRRWGSAPEMRKKAATGGGEDEGLSRRCRCTTKPPTPWQAAVEVAEQAQKLRVVGVGSSPASERRLPERGESRDGMCRCATKPSTPRLAAVEAAEQAKKLRVVGGEELTGVGKEAARGRRIEGWQQPVVRRSAVAAAARPVAEARGGRRKGRGGRRRRGNGPAHQLAPFMRRDVLVPQKAACRIPRPTYLLSANLPLRGPKRKPQDKQGNGGEILFSARRSPVLGHRVGQANPLATWATRVGSFWTSFL
jgi:hypothetical protein